MTRLRRSLLFTPGDSHRKIKKGLTTDADCVILELEDGVAFSRKEEARQIVADALTTLDFGHTERLVRINARDTGLAEADLAATLEGRPDGYLIPKVDSPDTIQWVSNLIAEKENQQGWPSGEIKVMAIIESALAVMNLREIANADTRLVALMFGAEDLAGDMGATRTAAGWEGFYAKSAVVTAAAAYGLDAIDTPHINIRDTSDLAAAAQQSLEMGYSGKLAIHPNQIETINQIFTPSAEAIAAAERLLKAYDDQAASGQGAFTLDGKMVDMPMVRTANKIMEKARQAYGNTC